MKVRFLLVILIAGTGWAGELTDAVKKQDAKRVAELLEGGADANDGKKGLTPLFFACARGYGEIAGLLARHGGTMGPEMVLDTFEFAKGRQGPDMLPAFRHLVRGGGKEYVIPVAALLWELGTGAAPGAARWLDDESEHVRRTARLALPHLARTSPEAIAALAKHDEFDTLALVGHVDAAVVAALARGVEKRDLAALRACARLEWPKKPAPVVKEPMKRLKKALAEARKDRTLKPLVSEATLALNRRRSVTVPGHPEGRRARRERDRKMRYALGERAIALGLRWLAAHQDRSDDGKWDADGFMKHDPADDRCDGPGGPLFDVGVTGLALLAFLGADHVPYGDTPYDGNLRAGLGYLLSVQAEDGTFGSRSSRQFIYNHAIATAAMCEAVIACRHPRYEEAARKAIALIQTARNPFMGWRYEPRGGENSTPATVWCMEALHLGRLAGIAVDPQTFAGGLSWIRKVTDPEYGQVGYVMPGGVVRRPSGFQDRFPAERSLATTAAGIYARLLVEEGAPRNRQVLLGAERISELPPSWNPDDGSIDMYYWYYATLALHQRGGKEWREWSKAIREVAVKHQHPRGSGSRTGSWDPIGPWGLSDGGRVYSTALMTLTLETSYRFARARGVR